MSPVSFQFDVALLKPVISETIRMVLEQRDQDQTKLGDRLAYSEAEAARLLGLRSHQLRDLRLRKGISASRGVGGRIFYQRQDLLDYLARCRID
jgi:hypothetical protein